MVTPSPTPPVLWHYTSLKGLIGIVSSESIWASDIRCLNDATEYQYGREIAIKATEANQVAPRDFLERMRELVVNQFSGEVRAGENFVFSMSERDDLLSQWRSYCPPGAGCSIGFDSSALSDRGFSAAVGYEFQLIQCVYTEDEQTAMINSVIEFGLECARGDHPSRTGSFLAGGLAGVVPRFKHPSFQEECEWRLLGGRDREHPRDNEKPIQYRAGKSMIVPYVKWALKPLPITEIKLGPCPHPELSRASVESLLATHKLTVPVTHSQIPYRAW